MSFKEEGPSPRLVSSPSSLKAALCLADMLIEFYGDLRVSLKTLDLKLHNQRAWFSMA
jgi:hypothetical protein